MGTKIIFFIISFFLLIGGVDYILGNKLKLGEQFKKGIETSGSLALNMIGIYLLAPLLADSLLALILPITRVFDIDPSIIPATCLATDMGGFQLANSLAKTSDMANFSGILLASNLGATLSFSIPVALGMIKKEDMPSFLQGLVIGIMTLPVGSFIGGIVQGIQIGELIKNCIPLLILSILLAYFTICHTKGIIRFFEFFSKFIVAISIFGLIVVGLEVVLGVNILPHYIPPLSEAAEVVIRIGLFLAGAYPMLKVLELIVGKYCAPLAKKLKVNEATITGMIGSLASNLLTFAEIEHMNTKGKVLASAFAISGAFVFGGQLAFVSTMSGEMVIPFIVSKGVSACLAVAIVQLTYREEKED